MRVAVVGAGISGLGAAYVLSRGHDVTLFEREERLGGHACTVRHDGFGLDCGFLVCNDHTYPLLMRLFGELGVATQPTEMSFAVTCRRHGLEYAGRKAVAQVHNLRHAGFARLAVDIARWLRVAEQALESRWANASLASFVRAHGLSDQFTRHFLAPFSSALWSTDPERVLDIPASFAVRFFQNHGLVGWGRREPWKTVTGGSHGYVDAISARLGTTIRAGTGVTSVTRHADGVDVRAGGDTVETFDQVVIATHADQALRLLVDPTDAERTALGRFRYTTNDAVLHTDERLLPRRAVDRSSWNFTMGDCHTPEPKPTVTYFLNRLQALDTETPYSVTLNRTADIAPASIIKQFSFTHPVFDGAALDGQARLRHLNAAGRTQFAGAHFGFGFHEDGLRSGVDAAANLGVRW